MVWAGYTITASFSVGSTSCLIILGLTVRNHWYLPVTSSCVLLQQRSVVYNFVITGNLKRNIAQFIVFTLQRPLILEQCLMVRRTKKYPLTQHFVTFYIPFMPWWNREAWCLYNHLDTAPCSAWWIYPKLPLYCCQKSFFTVIFWNYTCPCIWPPSLMLHVYPVHICVSVSSTWVLYCPSALPFLKFSIYILIHFWIAKPQKRAY